MTKINSAPQTPSKSYSIRESGLPPADHALYPATLAGEDDKPSNSARDSDSEGGGGTTQGNGSGG